MKIRFLLNLLPFLLLMGCVDARTATQASVTPSFTSPITPIPSLTPAPNASEEFEERELLQGSEHAGIIECGGRHVLGEESGANGRRKCISCHGDVEIDRQHSSETDPIHSSLACAVCHDPHSTRASCSNEICHTGIRANDVIILATPPGGHPHLSTGFCPGVNCHPQATEAALTDHDIHGSRHAVVACTACHNVSGLEAGPTAKKGYWITTPVMEGTQTPQATARWSHAVQKGVDCKRCHYEENPWSLPLVRGNEYGG